MSIIIQPQIQVRALSVAGRPVGNKDMEISGGVRTSKFYVVVENPDARLSHC